MGFAFFKVPKHRVFDYKPRFYDPEKERREQRRRELGLVEEDVEDGEYKPGSIIRNSGMKSRHEAFTQKMSKSRRQSRLFVVVFVVMFSIIAYYLFVKSPTFRNLLVS